MAIHQTKPFLPACLEEVLDLNTYQFSLSQLQYILNQYTWHLLPVCLLLLQAIPGFLPPGLPLHQPTCRLLCTSPIPLALQSMAAIHRHNQLQIRPQSTEQFHLLQEYWEEVKGLSHQALEFVASFQCFPTEILGTSSARNSASSISSKVARNHGKNQAAKSSSSLLERIAE